MSADDHPARSFECKLYYCAAGIGSTPVWTEFPGVGSVTLTPTMKESDVPIRGLGGFDGSEPTLNGITIEFDCPYVRGDPNRLVFEAAYYGRTRIGVAVMDEGIAVTGANGLWADVKVFSIPRDESIDKTVTQKFTLKPCYPSNSNGTFNSPIYHTT